MEILSAEHLSALFRKTREELLFPPWLAGKHASFILSYRSSMTPDAFSRSCLANWEQTNAVFEEILDATSEEAIREIFARMTPEEAAYYEDRLRAVGVFLDTHPEISLRRDETRGEMFWIDLLKKLLVVPCPPP